MSVFYVKITNKNKKITNLYYYLSLPKRTHFKFLH